MCLTPSLSRVSFLTLTVKHPTRSPLHVFSQTFLLSEFLTVTLMCLNPNLVFSLTFLTMTRKCPNQTLCQVVVYSFSVCGSLPCPCFSLYAIDPLTKMPHSAAVDGVHPVIVSTRNGQVCHSCSISEHKQCRCILLPRKCPCFYNLAANMMQPTASLIWQPSFVWFPIYH